MATAPHWLVRNETVGTILADRGLRASSFADRFVGLMGRRVFPVGEALHIVPCNSIHTFFMHLPIDVLFLSADSTVVRLDHALVPWRTTSIVWPARSVLELPAGVARASRTEVGHQISFGPVALPLTAAPGVA